MKKTIITVFSIIGILVLVLLVWQIVFNDGGIVKTAYNSFGDAVNSVWSGIAGDRARKIIPEWKGDRDDVDFNEEHNLDDAESHAKGE